MAEHPFVTVGALGLYGALLLGSLAMVTRRRRLQPLRFRDPYLLIATVTSTFLSNVSSHIVFLLGIENCLPRVLLLNIPSNVMVTTISARFWKLLLASQITQARLMDEPRSWILRYPWLTSSRYLWLTIAFLNVFLLCVQLALGFSSAECVMSSGSIAFYALLLMSYWLGIATMTWKLRRIQDGFFVVPELKMLGTCILLGNVYVIAVLASGRTDVTFLPIIVESIAELIIQTWYPLGKSYRMAQATSLDSDDRASLQSKLPDGSALGQHSARRASALGPGSSFLDLLLNPDGFDAMKRFLTTEFSVENLLCWRQLHERKRERRPDQVQAHFRAIYDTFIRDGSPNEVNINSQLKQHFKDVVNGKSVRLDLITQMKAAKPDPGAGSLDPDTDLKLRLLKQLHRELVKLMQMDSFQRFKQTAEYRNLVHADPHVIHAVL